MGLFKTVTQGGQVHLHQLRMLKQVFTAGLCGAILAGGGYLAWECLKIPNYAWRRTYETYWAKFMFVSTPDTKHKELFQIYTPSKRTYSKNRRISEERPYKRSCISVLKDPVLKKTTRQVERYVANKTYLSVQFGGIAFFAIMALWFVLGRLQKKPHHKRGNTLVEWKELLHLLKTNKENSNLTFEKLPFIKNKETSHILITGTTGSGKTNGFHILLPQIRKRKDRAIILDVTGDYISRYYDEKTDLILNPLDERSLSWSPWADCHLDSHYDVLPESFIQTKEGNRDPFWDNASRTIFKTALRKYAAMENTNIEDFQNFLLSATDREFENFFKGTEAATFAVKSNEKTTHSIRSVLSSQIECLQQLEQTTTPFSIRDWVSNDPPSLLHSSGVTSHHSSMRGGGWLFITARPDQRETLRPLISAWVDLSINSLMTLPENQDRRLWFIIDELAALQKLPRLQAGLAEGRKYGGCLLVGFQSKPQLEEIYGRNGTEAMLDLFNTKIFFRCTEPSTQQWISKVLGDKEEEEPQENISYGAHHMRDGVSLTRHTRQKPLVMPGEFSQLKDLECYIKLPGDYPCTKLQTSYQQSPSEKREAFKLKPEKKRVYTFSSIEILQNDLELEEVS